MDWLEFHNYWMDHSVENGMSVMAINKADARLAGGMTVRNLDYRNPEFDKKFSDPTHPLTPLLAILGKKITKDKVFTIFNAHFISGQNEFQKSLQTF